MKMIELGAAFAGNTINALTTRRHGLLTVNGWSHLAFYRPDGEIAVERFRIDETAERECFSLPSHQSLWDAHRSINLGIDSVGRTHLFWGAHNSPPLFTCSLSADLRDGFAPPRAADSDKGRALTYPTFIHRGPGLDPLLLMREGRFDNACWWIRRLDHRSGSWVADSVPLLDGRSSVGWSCGPYLDPPVAGSKGTIHFTWSRRISPLAAHIGPVGNIGIDYFYTDLDMNSLFNDRSIRLTQPITPASSQPIAAVGLGAQLMNQCSLAVSPDGRPVLATIWAGRDGIPQYRLVAMEQDGWRAITASTFSTPYILDGYGTLPTPHSRPALLISSDGSYLLIFRSREMGDRLVLRRFFPPLFRLEEAEEIILVDTPLGHYEPIVDLGAWTETGIISIYVQYCDQPNNDSESKIPTSRDASIMIFSI